MGPTGAFEYYDNRPFEDQTTTGNTGVSNSFGNRNLREEQADTFTLGVVMDVLDNITLTVDWYEIELKDMIALEGPDAIYQRCLDLAFNPTSDPTTQACILINRDSANGSPSNVDRTFTNQGRALMSGADLQLNWTRDLWGGAFSMNTVANFVLKSITQDRPDLEEEDHAGLNDCSLQIECQRYDYRLFTTSPTAAGRGTSRCGISTGRRSTMTPAGPLPPRSTASTTVIRATSYSRCRAATRSRTGIGSAWASRICWTRNPRAWARIRLPSRSRWNARTSAAGPVPPTIRSGGVSSSA